MSVLWQVAPYAVLTLAEVLVSATGLEFAYSQAPREMKGTIMSFWNLTVTIGNLLVAGVAAINVFESTAGSLFFYAGLIFLAAMFFAFMASRYKVRDYFQKAAVPVLGEHSRAGRGEGQGGLRRVGLERPGGLAGRSEVVKG